MKRIGSNVCFCTFFLFLAPSIILFFHFFKSNSRISFFQSAQGYLFSDLDDETQEFFELRAPRGDQGGRHLWVVMDEERRARDANFGEGGGSDVPQVKKKRLKTTSMLFMEMESSLARARKPDGSTRFFLSPTRPEPDFFYPFLYEKSGLARARPELGQTFFSPTRPEPDC